MTLPSFTGSFSLSEADELRERGLCWRTLEGLFTCSLSVNSGLCKKGPYFDSLFYKVDSLVSESLFSLRGLTMDAEADGDLQHSFELPVRLCPGFGDRLILRLALGVLSGPEVTLRGIRLDSLLTPGSNFGPRSLMLEGCLNLTCEGFMSIFLERVLIWEVDSISLFPCRSFYGNPGRFNEMPLFKSILILAFTGFDNLEEFESAILASI